MLSPAADTRVGLLVTEAGFRAARSSVALRPPKTSRPITGLTRSPRPLFISCRRSASFIQARETQRLGRPGCSGCRTRKDVVVRSSLVLVGFDDHGETRGSR